MRPALLLVPVLCLGTLACRHDEQLPATRDLQLLPATETVAYDTTALLTERTRALLRLLGLQDTSGIGRYLDAGFSWQPARIARGGSPTTVPRLRDDPDYLLRFASGVPLLDNPPMATFDVRYRVTGAYVIARADCGDVAPCDFVIVSWENTSADWKAVAVQGGSGRYRTSN
jgi:hypothetical protein